MKFLEKSQIKTKTEILDISGIHNTQISCRLMQYCKFWHHFEKTVLHLFVISLFLTQIMIISGCSKKDTAASKNAASSGGTGPAQQEIILKNAEPQHIIALSPAATEILFAVGAGNQIAACSEYSDYPKEALLLPRVGGFDGKTLSIETILSYKPDFVYLTAGMHDFLIPSLEEFGINYYVSKGTSIKNITDEIIEIAKITGHPEKGKELVNKIENDISECKKNLKSEQKSLYWEVWNSPYMSAGKSSFINDLISAAGYENIFGSITEAWPIVSEETIIAKNPDIILIPATSGVTEESVKKRLGWENINAVKNGKIFIVDDNLVTRPGARIGESVKTLWSLDN